MDLQRVAVKLFAAEGTSVPLEEFIPVFHGWIRDRRAGGTPVDVSDYSHVTDGPGVVLIGHESDVFMDAAEGPFGMIYNRKRGLQGSIDDRWRTCFREALAAAANLEADFKGRLKFRADELLVVFNDRLVPPDKETLDALAKVATELLDDAKTAPREDDARSRRAVWVRGKAADVAALQSRLK